MAFTRQEQALKVAAKFLTLVALAKESIKVPNIGFQRLGGKGDINSLRHLIFLLFPSFYHCTPSVNKLPLQRHIQVLSQVEREGIELPPPTNIDTCL